MSIAGSCLADNRRTAQCDEVGAGRGLDEGGVTNHEEGTKERSHGLNPLNENGLPMFESRKNVVKKYLGVRRLSLLGICFFEAKKIHPNSQDENSAEVSGEMTSDQCCFLT